MIVQNIYAESLTEYESNQMRNERIENGKITLFIDKHVMKGKNITIHIYTLIYS